MKNNSFRQTICTGSNSSNHIQQCEKKQHTHGPPPYLRCRITGYDNMQVEGHLYASGDASVCPATPAALRSGGGGKTGMKAGAGAGGTARTGAGRGAAESIGDGLPCGFSEIPGWRITMEDATCR